VGDRDLIEAARRTALGLADSDPLFADLFDLETGKVTDHIGQHIGLRITDLVKDLFADGGAGHQTARALWLGNDEGAIGGAFDNRIANMGPVRHALPIGKEPARGLRPALDDVTGQGAARQLIIVAGLPAKFVHQGGEHEGGIDHPARDDHIGPSPQGRDYWVSPEIDAGIEHRVGGGKAITGHHLAYIGQTAQIAAQIIALDNGDVE
jgi:hypothetical protein